MDHSFSFEVIRTAHASADKAFELVRDAPAWARWGGVLIPHAAWKDRGPTAHDSVVGRTRHMVGVVEEHITADERATAPGGTFVHGYTIAPNRFFRDYHAELQLRQDASTTHLRWRGSFVATNKPLGTVIRAGFVAYIGLLAGALLKAARS